MVDYLSKCPATGTRGMVVANHPLASAAGAELLAGGGNAIDAAIGALFTLTVVEPPMVGVLGGGIAHLRLADGRHVVVDGQTTAPLATGPETFRRAPNAPPGSFEAIGGANTVGATAIAVPGALMAWCETLRRYGTLALADVIEPAIRHARRGFRVSQYLATCIAEAAPDLARDPASARVFLPGGRPLAPGDRLRQPECAATLAAIAEQGPGLLYDGPLGEAAVACVSAGGGFLSREDLRSYRSIEREPVRGSYRGLEVVAPPPPSAGGVHLVQMLQLLERFDLAALGAGSADAAHLVAEALKLAFADRNASTGDPAFVETPVERLLSQAYADERARELDAQRARAWSAGAAPTESSNTTHLTVADDDGNVVASTQSLFGLFGSCVGIPGTGLLANNYLYQYDPEPGRALSLAPGKRATTSMAPTIVLDGGQPRYALGTPGGARIFGCVAQALLNLVDHRLPLQQALDAPRLWTEGFDLQVESGVPQAARAALAARGHDVTELSHIPGGMTAIELHGDGTLTGAACWRADGAPVGIAGGPARPGVTFKILPQHRDDQR